MMHNQKKLFVILLIAILVVALAISTIIVVACGKLTRQEEIAEEGITEVAINNKQYASGEEATVVETWDISASESDSVTATLYSDGKVVISGTGAMKSWSGSSSVAWYNYREDITTVEISQGVTSIGACAFEGCSSLTSIIIPDSVTSIGSNPFIACSSLISITVEENNNNYCSIDGVLFNKEKTNLLCYPASKEGLTYTIPDSVTIIESRAFSYCGNLTSVEIPDNITNIGDEAFGDCSSLTSIEIPDGVTSIGSMAFRYCISLTSIDIPRSITSLGSYAFVGCSSLISITVETNNKNYCSIDGILFNKDATTIMCYPAGKDSTTYTIPNSVTSIENGSFYGCSNLTNITIPSSVTSIGSSAFGYCSSLISINIPERVTRIGVYAFQYCSSLTSIDIPDGVTSIGTRAFYGCKDIEAVQIGEYDNGEITIDLPELVQRTLDENDILYANGEAPTLTNCTIEDNKVTFKGEDVKKQNVKIYINSGALEGVSVVVVPSGTILYNKTSWTNQDVVATIFVEDDETITNNNGSNEYTFTKNGEFTFTYTDKNGEAQSSIAKVDWIIELTSNKYTIGTSNIKQVQPKTTVKQFKENITTNAENVKVYNASGTELKDTDVAGTNMTLKLNDAVTYTLIVKGDCTGDGQANLSDILAINKYRLGKATLTANYLSAADTNGDGKVDLSDILQINKYRLGKTSSL